MQSLNERPELIGFFSYAREDDADSRGALTALRECIQAELRSQLGHSMRNFRLWQDKQAIAPGTLWEAEIATAVSQSVFFIPIITPTTTRSEFCRFEFNSFLEREKQLGRSDLVFPILYIRVPALEDPARVAADPLLAMIAARQYVDWREFRHKDAFSTEVREAVEALCHTITEALGRPIDGKQDNSTRPTDATNSRNNTPRTKPTPDLTTKRPTPATSPAPPAALPPGVATAAPAPTRNRSLLRTTAAGLLGAAVTALCAVMLLAPQQHNPPLPPDAPPVTPTAAAVPITKPQPPIAAPPHQVARQAQPAPEPSKASAAAVATPPQAQTPEVPLQPIATATNAEKAGMDCGSGHASQAISLAATVSGGPNTIGFDSLMLQSIEYYLRSHQIPTVDTSNCPAATLTANATVEIHYGVRNGESSTIASSQVALNLTGTATAQIITKAEFARAEFAEQSTPRNVALCSVANALQKALRSDTITAALRNAVNRAAIPMESEENSGSLCSAG